MTETPRDLCPGTGEAPVRGGPDPTTIRVRRRVKGSLRQVDPMQIGHREAGSCMFPTDGTNTIAQKSADVASSR